METYTLVVVIICMILYTIYAIWQIAQFEHLASGIFGTAAVIAGGVEVYLVAPFIAAAILWLLKALGVIAVIAILIGISGE